MPELSVNGHNVSYEECPGSPSESIAGGMFRSTRSFEMDWGDRWYFVAGMLGFPSLRVDPGTGLSYISRQIAQGYYSDAPDLAGVSKWLFPTAVERIEPQGTSITYDNANVAEYQKAKVSLTYEAVTYSMRTDDQMLADGYLLEDEDGNENFLPGDHRCGRYVTRFYMPTAEYLTLPFGGLVWAEEGTKVPVAGSIGRIVAATEVMFIWHQVPAIPEAVHTHVGTINDATFPTFVTGNDRQFERGTLLLTSVDVKPYRWFFNQRLYDITYKFKYFQPETGLDTSTDFQGIPINEPFGHNHFLRYRPGAGLVPTYQLLTYNGLRPTAPTPGIGVYEYADFRDLFELEGVDDFQ